MDFTKYKAYIVKIKEAVGTCMNDKCPISSLYKNDEQTKRSVKSY